VNAEIIAVGSELLGCRRLDTNSLFLTEQLNSIGVEVVTKCVVGDDRDRLADAVLRAVRRSPVVILSGGLGPTQDDVTREAVAQALDRKLVFHPEIAEDIEQRFARAGRKMAEVNRRQAFVVEGAEILPNDRGTAPGLWIEDSGVSVMLLPGPPHELQAMFVRQCAPRLARRVPNQAIATLVLRVSGISESELDQLIAPVYTKYENPATTVLAAPGDIQVHLRARQPTEAEALALLAEVGGPIELLLGDRIYSRNGDPLEAVVGELLRKRHATLAVAESCTGGLLAERLTSVPGSSAYFLGGVVAYDRRLKVEWLGVGEQLIEEFGTVSGETAQAMALGVKRRAGATYGVAITGTAGPGDGGEKGPVGTVYIAIADPAGCEVHHRVFLSDRARVRAFAAQNALDYLRRRIAAVMLA
jgi:nicotinamide-nucleotide amidase